MSCQPEPISELFIDFDGGAVVGFHATRLDTAQAIISAEEFTASKNPWDWLGWGIYFWEDNYHRAKQWALDIAIRTEQPAAIIKATINRGRNLNFANEKVQEAFERTSAELTVCFTGSVVQPPQNKSKQLYWDCLVWDLLVALHAQEADTVRRGFSELSSRGIDQTHIQLCVRNPNAILNAEIVDVVQPQEGARYE